MPYNLPTLADMYFVSATPFLFLQDGLVGNRTVSSGDVWGLVTAATRAFPIQLSPSVEKAQEVVAAGAGEGDLLSTWILQVRRTLLTGQTCGRVAVGPAALSVSIPDV
jgi:hypothetical protein